MWIVFFTCVAGALSQNVNLYPAGVYPILGNTEIHPLGTQYPLPGLGNLGYQTSRRQSGGRNYIPQLYPQPPYSVNPAGQWQRYFPSSQASRILLPRHNIGLSGASLLPQQSISQLGGPRVINTAQGQVPSVASASLGLDGRISPIAPLNESPASRLQSRLQLLRSLRTRRTGAESASGNVLSSWQQARARTRPDVSLRQLRSLNLGLDNRQLRALLRRGGLSALEPKLPKDLGKPVSDITFDNPPKAPKVTNSQPTRPIQNDIAQPNAEIIKALRLPTLSETKISTRPETVSRSRFQQASPSVRKPVPVEKLPSIHSLDKAIKPTVVKSARPCPRKDYSPCVTSDEFNRRALKCCKTLPSIPQGCYHLCNMEVTPFQITRALQSGQCPVGAFQPFLICLSEGHDLTPCCEAHRLTKGRKDVCSAFCNPQQGFNPNAGFQYLRCIGQFRKLAACYWSSMN